MFFVRCDQPKNKKNEELLNEKKTSLFVLFFMNDPKNNNKMSNVFLVTWLFPFQKAKFSLIEKNVIYDQKNGNRIARKTTFCFTGKNIDENF